jgi:uncharacterized phage protein (TIGR01671 family)
MREIEFRAYIHGKMEYLPFPYNMVGAAELDEYSSDVTWMQFTGLHDKDGKDMYEGDRVMVSYKEDGEEVSSPGIVEWYGPQGMFVVKLGDPQGENESWGLIKFSSFDVFGHIYESGDASA